MLERENKEVDSWGDDYFEPRPNSRQVKVRGRVFLDAAASPSRGGGTRPPLKGIPVSDEERIVVTEQDGAFSFSMFVDEHRVVRLQLPSGFRPTTPWYQLIRGDDTRTDYFFEFGLRKTPETAAGKAFNFVVITDSQFSDQKAAERYREDLRQIETLSETPEFIRIAGTWARPAGCASGNCTTGRFGIWPYRSTTWLAGTRRTTAKAHGWNARPTGISSCFAAPPGMPLTSPASISSSSTSTNSAAVPPHWRDNRRG